MEELTQENYYQDTSWLTNSRFKRYQQCQAKAFALDSGHWVEERDETPLLLGNYVHSYFESEEAHQAIHGRKWREATSQDMARTKETSNPTL